MSSGFRFELDREGVRELLTGSKMQKIVEECAAKKAAQAGSGYASAVHLGKKRCYANVYPETKEALHDNWDNNTLEKVIRS